MALHTINGFITYETNDYSDGPKIDFYTYDPSKMAHRRGQLVVVREHSFEVEVADDFDPRPGMVATLREQQNKVRAEMSARINELQAQINNLLALEAA